MISEDEHLFQSSMANTSVLNRKLLLQANIRQRQNLTCRQPTESLCGNSSDATSSHDDSDSDYISNQEDAGKSTEDIIAPPSPFVTRNNNQNDPSNLCHLKQTSNVNNKTCKETNRMKGKPFHSTTIYIGSQNNDLKRLNEAKSSECKYKNETDIKTAPETTEDTKEDQPKVYPAANAPICKSCMFKEASFFNPDCSLCWDMLKNDYATPSHVFAILRLWVPQVQRCIRRLIWVGLAMGCKVNDRDYVTDMTLLHYAVKAGSNGMGNTHCALQIVSDLLKKGADLRQRCKWTCMTALHYAAYFDVPAILELILSCTDGVPIDDPCLEYNNGSPLHISAANLSESAAKVLLQHGASIQCKDNLGRIPFECIPTPEQFDLLPDLQEISSRMCQFFKREWGSKAADDSCYNGGALHGINGRAILKAIGIDIGSRVLVSGTKTAILRYVGPTEFATGLWAGVELESPKGRHNGTVKGVTYFICAKYYGLFVPINRLTKIPNVSFTSPAGRERTRFRLARSSHDKLFEQQTSSSSILSKRSTSLPPRKVNYGKVNVSKISSKVAQDIKKSTRKIEIGDNVYVDIGIQVWGVVQYVGNVHFASGCWVGIELDEPRGLHDGSVCGTRYFTCTMRYGIFAISNRVKKQNPNLDTSMKPYHRRPRASSLTKMYPYHSHSNSLDGFNSISNSTPSLLRYEDDFSGPFSLTPQTNDTVKSSLFNACSSLSNINKCFTGRYLRSRQRQEELQRQKEEIAKEPQWIESQVFLDYKDRLNDKESSHWLKIGHSVFYRNKIGTVRFIGQVHFAEGTWLGIELREKKGRHDGKVEGKRYFKCRRGHGLIVPPKMVTVHGISGDRLVEQFDEQTITSMSFDKLLIV